MTPAGAGPDAGAAPLRGYQRLIAEATGTTDPVALAVLEELMREERPTLDALTRNEFMTLARRASHGLAALRDAGFLADYCAAFGLEVPAADMKVVLG